MRVLIIAMLLSGCADRSEEFIRVPLELPEREQVKVKAKYPPPEPYTTPMKNWWGTPDDPITWPE